MNHTSFIHIGIAVLVLLLTIGLFIGATVSVNSMEQKAATLQTEIALAEAKVGRVAAAKEALPALARAEAITSAYLLRSADIVPFLETLERKGKAQSASVTVLSVHMEQASTRPRIAISVTITGAFNAVVRTLGTIEHAPYDIRVVNATVEKTGTPGKGPSAWTASVVLSIGAEQGTITATQP